MAIQLMMMLLCFWDDTSEIRSSKQENVFYSKGIISKALERDVFVNSMDILGLYVLLKVICLKTIK